MTTNWSQSETTTHQDHVIAHVVEATPMGYVVVDEVLNVLLDIGFVWTILLNGEMGLLPHPVAVKELEVDGETREQINADIDELLGDNVENLNQLIRLPEVGSINSVELFDSEEQHRLLISCEQGSVEIETSLTNAEIKVKAETA